MSEGIAYNQSFHGLALLLESKMIKEQLPLYNRQLRRLKKMYILRPEYSGLYKTISLDFVNAEEVSPDLQIYGVYPSRMKAKNALESLQKTYDLCPKLLGLEKSASVCFKYQLGKCLGACGDKEDAASYNQRFETAFERNKIEKWPYHNPVVVLHKEDQASGKHLVIDNWNVIGELKNEEGCETHFQPWQNVFDIDTYKIIRSYISQKTSDLLLKPITYGELEAYNW